MLRIAPLLSRDAAFELCRDVLFHMPVGLHLYRLEDPEDDRTLRFIGSNPAAERITGASASQYIGRTLDENFPSLRAAGIPQAYAEVARTGRPWSTDHLEYGDERVLRAAYAVQAFGLPGDCLGVVFEDATPRIRAQEELRISESRQRALVEALPDTLYRLASDGSLHDVRTGGAAPTALELRVAAYAADPMTPGDVRVFEYQEGAHDFEVRLVRSGASELLAIVRDISERKLGERRKDEFISIVSHELRTPLTSIRGALGLIEGGVLGAASAPIQELVCVARSNTDRLVRLINDMLDLDKMEAGRMELDVVALDATELVDSALAGVRGAADLAGVRLRHVTSGPVSVLGDRDRLLQVLTNLLSNAVRFSPPQATVTVTVEASVPGWVRFVVQDSGPGVPHERAGHLFRKFNQISGEGARRGGGTGLGLAISKAIVEQHGGGIGVSAKDGPGAAFFFELPVTPEPPATVEESARDALFGDLRAAYAASLPGQVEVLVARIERRHADPAAMAEALGLSHRIAGTAGTYGLPAVSEATARIERALRGALEDPVELAAAVRQLREAVPRG